MTKYLIHGGRPLHGTIHISGAKNAAVAIIPAALLVDGVCRIENVPQISDVTLILQILRELGADVRLVNRTTVEVDCSHIRNRQVPYELARRIRASYYLVGALLSRFGWAEVPLPGGCDLGGRPVDQHIKGFVSMGADIRGAGTDVIKIHGVARLRGGSYSIIPDQIEAGTYMAAVAAAGGDVLIRNVIPKHLDCITAKLVEMGVDVEELDDALRLRREGPMGRVNVKTMPYPGFPTDMQPQIAAALCVAQGTSVLTEGVWDNRYRYVDEFRRMGAKIQVDGKVAVIEGVEHLTGAPIHACDLRAGAAMIIAGLAAQGVTEIDGIHHIERGYETIVEKLANLGADIQIISVPGEDDQAQVG